MNADPGSPPPMRPDDPNIIDVVRREVMAIEHPMLVMDVDKGLKTFGKNHPFQRIMESTDPEESLPLYLRHNDPMCAPILSQNIATTNVVLKITVPKRTGRKRKRGSQDPYVDGNGKEPTTAANINGSQVKHHHLASQSRMDNPTEIIRKLKDNSGKYTIEAVGQVNQTHRYRALADFHHSTSNTAFISKLQDTVLTGDLPKLREFKFDPSRGWKPNEEFIPPPVMTPHAVPFNWSWLQNPSVIEQVDPNTGKSYLVNRDKGARHLMEYLSPTIDDIPHGPSRGLPKDKALLGLISDLQRVFDERPCWTRRSLINRLANHPTAHLMKFALPYVAYKFKGGPFRDAIVKFGIDPRKDKKYRMYQTLFFQMYELDEKKPGLARRDTHTNFLRTKKGARKIDTSSHLFDGENLTLDGRLWQMCDITDPLLARLIQDSPYQTPPDIEYCGYFLNGSLAKIRAIMRLKLIAIRISKHFKDEDFQDTIQARDFVPGIGNNLPTVPLPTVKLTERDIEILKDSGMEHIARLGGIQKGVHRTRHERIRFGDPSRRKDNSGGASAAESDATESLEPAISGVQNGMQDARDPNLEGYERNEVDEYEDYEDYEEYTDYSEDEYDSQLDDYNEVEEGENQSEVDYSSFYRSIGQPPKVGPE